MRQPAEDCQLEADMIQREQRDTGSTDKPRSCKQIADGKQTTDRNHTVSQQSVDREANGGKETYRIKRQPTQHIPDRHRERERETKSSPVCAHEGRGVRAFQCTVKNI